MQVDSKIYPFSGKYVTVNGHRLHYLDEGSGPPVLMLHGNPSWSIYYRNLVTALQENWRCIVPDHIGCGYSDKPSSQEYDYSFLQRAKDIEALLDELGISEPITLVLHDWGGLIGMTYATKYIERIARVVLLNTAAFHLPETKKFPAALALARNTSLGSFLIRGFNAFSRGAAWVGCKRKPMGKELRDAYCAPYDSWNNRVATLRFVQDIPLKPEDRGYAELTQVQETLPRLQSKPTLICWGLKDFVFDRHFLERWEEILPEAQVHRFDDCGHYVLEDASDEVIPLIKDFLAA
tara:strand:+ start:91 stop:969 length:879 start_codon:yes stop_codon:yes gene_type:complete